MMQFDTLEQAQQQALAALQSGNENQAMNILSASVTQFPHDGLLLYFYGAELAQQQQYELALEQLSNAVFNAPQLHIARFQLALLAGTMERSDLVEQHLPYLMELRESHYLGYFANALAAVFANDLDSAAQLIHSGIQENQENPALNQDMQQLLERVNSANQGQSDTDEAEQDNSNITGSVLLDIYKNTH